MFFRMLVLQALCAVMYLGSSGTLSAQVEYGSSALPLIDSVPGLYVDVQDGLMWYRVRGTDTTPADRISASYQFEMAYDSTNRVNYMFTECKLNSQRLRLKGWVMNKLVGGLADLLTDSSRTESFELSTGDSISFYREFRWYNPITHVQDTSNYYALDTLDYSVELVRVSDGQRLALLDTIGILAQATPGAPVFYGTHPVMAHIKYAVPSNLNGDTAFVRIRLNARGDGDYHFMRLSTITLSASRSLLDPFFIDYLNGFGGFLSKVAVQRLLQPAGEGEHTHLSVTTMNNRTISIAFGSEMHSGGMAISIFNELGELVFTPFSSLVPVKEHTILYQMPRNGVYFVALCKGGAIVRTQKVVVIN